MRAAAEALCAQVVSGWAHAAPFSSVLPYGAFSWKLLRPPPPPSASSAGPRRRQVQGGRGAVVRLLPAPSSQHHRTTGLRLDTALVVAAPLAAPQDRTGDAIKDTAVRPLRARRGRASAAAWAIASVERSGGGAAAARKDESCEQLCLLRWRSSHLPSPACAPARCRTAPERPSTTTRARTCSVRVLGSLAAPQRQQRIVLIGCMAAQPGGGGGGICRCKLPQHEDALTAQTLLGHPRRDLCCLSCCRPRPSSSSLLLLLCLDDPRCPPSTPFGSDPVRQRDPVHMIACDAEDDESRAIPRNRLEGCL